MQIQKKLSLNKEIWTRDFTLLTLGSVVSYMGNSTIIFVMGAFVLDSMNSVLAYSIYLCLFNVIRLIVPIISGTFLDCFSRKKTIYILDYASAGIFLIFWILLRCGDFKIWMVIPCAIFIGIIDSTYKIAFRSLFPMLVEKEKLPQAYAMQGALETMSMIMVPIGMVLYKSFGIEPVLLVSSLLFLIAASMEVFIRAEENYIDRIDKTNLKTYIKELGEGFVYLKEKKVLITIVLFEFLIAFYLGTQNALWYPFFNAEYSNGYLWFCIATGGIMTGCFWGSVLMYLVRIPKDRKYIIFCITSMFAFILGSLFLIVPIGIMIAFSLVMGISLLLVYNIRTAASQSAIDDERKGRFNGVLSTMNSFGLMSSELLAGLLSKQFDLATINAIFMIVVAGIQLVVCIYSKRELKKLIEKGEIN